MLKGGDEPASNSEPRFVFYFFAPLRHIYEGRSGSALIPVHFFLAQLEEIKALMEEMDLDSVEVRLEVEVELSSDSDCNDAEDVAEVEDDSGDELVSSGSEESDGCGEERFARGVLALSSNSCSDASDSSSGDDEDDMCDRKSAGVEVGSDVDGRLASAFTLWP